MGDKDAQILIYTSYLHIIGGIETFLFNFIELLSSDYDLGVVCPRMPEPIEKKLREKVKVFKKTDQISCDTLIMVRKMDPRPVYVQYDYSIRMVHACKSDPSSLIMHDCDRIVHVSEASRQSFKSDGDVIHNSLFRNDKRALMLVSATRIPALDKGKNAERMLKLAEMLNEKEIPFLWFNFSDAPLKNAPQGFINVGTFHELQPYIARADYLVQLSDHEGFGFSVLEALVSGTAVLCTEFETVHELGVVDGENGYILPFDLNFDVEKLLTVPSFTYTWDNTKIRKKWDRLLKHPKPKKKPIPKNMVEVFITGEYNDIELHRIVRRGERLFMSEQRARAVSQAGYCKIL